LLGQRRYVHDGTNPGERLHDHRSSRRQVGKSESIAAAKKGPEVFLSTQLAEIAVKISLKVGDTFSEISNGSAVKHCSVPQTLVSVADMKPQTLRK